MMKETLEKIFEKENRLWVLIFCLIFFTGAGIRFVRFCYNFPLHVDESMLAMNMIDLSYWDLFMNKALDYHQAAPSFFMLISKLFYSVVKYHHTAFFSDLVLRILPLISGILTIPVFAYLVWSWFKDKYMTIIGTLMMTFSIPAIAYADKFKQYTTEILITSVLLILFSKIDFENKPLKKNIILCILVFLCLYCSMTAIFIIMCGILYFMIKSMLNKNYQLAKKILLYGCLGLLLYIATMYQVYTITNQEQHDDWENIAQCFNILNIKNFIEKLSVYLFRVEIFKGFIFDILFIVTTIIAICRKDMRILILIILPILQWFILHILNLYPASERLCLYLLPIFIIAMMYFVQFIPKKVYFLKGLVLITVMIAMLQPIIHKNGYNIMLQSTRYAWDYLDKSMGSNAWVIYATPHTINYYYERFYPNVRVNHDVVLGTRPGRDGLTFADRINSLDKGVYYIFFPNKTKLHAATKSYILKNTKVLDVKYFVLRDGVSYKADSMLIKLKK